MKNLLQLLSVILMLFIASQVCKASNPYICTKEGTILKYTTFNAKGEVKEHNINTILKVTQTDNETLVIVRFVILDKKGKPASKNNAVDEEYLITKDKAILNLAALGLSYISQKEKEFPGIKIKVTSNGVAYPIPIHIGKEMEPFTMSIKCLMLGVPIARGNMQSTKREIVAQEQIITPAGTFDCWKIIEEIKTKVSVSNMKFQTIAWYAEGIGIVKYEDIDENGKLESTTTLTSIEYPE